MSRCQRQKGGTDAAPPSVDEYIFRAKNYYGMKDTQDVVIQAKDPLGDGASREELERRLLENTAEIEVEADSADHKI